MTTIEEVKKLQQNGWVITDPSCNQMRKKIIEDKIYVFREDRTINPVTKESELFEEELDYDNYGRFELVDSCKTFGYTSEQIDNWITEGEEIALMLECVFELSN